jgi:Calcineurin-like phosphoesterase
VLDAGGQNRAIFLPPTAVDWDVTADVSLDKAPLGGGSAWVYHELRRSTANTNAYRAIARFAGTGQTFVSVSRVVSGTETQIGGAVAVPSVNFLTGFTLRGQVTGTNPTTIKVKAWVGTEPAAWQLTVTDSAGPQVAGRAGVRSYSSGTTSNAPLTFLIDNYVGTSDDVVSPPPPPPPPPTDVTFVGAGDIADGTGDFDAQTANLLDAIPGTVFTLGDTVYPNGSTSDFNNYFAPTWGRHKSRIIPAVGNHEYQTANAAGYYAYFGAAAGDPTKGYYSKNLGAWHIIVLNGNCTIISCAAGSAQEQWLRADLAANTSVCTLAMWHQPRFSSGDAHGNDTSLGPIWNALYQYNADLVLNGHDHDYERFAPQNPSGVADSVRGIQEFVLGTGGVDPRGFATIRANSQVRASPNGVMKFTLKATGYDFQFVPIAGQTFTDSGSGTCH